MDPASSFQATDTDHDERLARLTLASLPSMYPRRLAAVLREHSGIDALDALRGNGRLRDGVVASAAALTQLRVEAREHDVDTVVSACDASGVLFAIRGDDHYPARLRRDPEAPEVLFHRGDLGLCDRRTVAIVGTRRSTAAGRATATELALGLARRGIAIVSGLAAGIDAASHRHLDQVPDAAAIAVVGSGPDVAYPRTNEALWERLARTGVIISEWGPGAAPEAWHFPLRNRIIAALAEVVVVVESRESGGSLITARAALDRGVDVLAVPGSVHCRAASGTNRLIADGAGVVCSVDDVLDALGLISPTADDRDATEWVAGAASPELDDALSRLDRYGPLGIDIYRLCRERPHTIDQLVETTRARLIDVARVAVQLEHDGLLADANGWLEAVGSRLVH